MAFFLKLPPELVLQITDHLSEHDLSSLLLINRSTHQNPIIRYRLYQRILPRLERNNGPPFYLANRKLCPITLYGPTITDRLVLSGDITAINSILAALSEEEVKLAQHASRREETRKIKKLGGGTGRIGSRSTILSLRLISRACFHGQLPVLHHMLSQPGLDLRSVRQIGRYINPFFALLFAPKEAPRKEALLALHAAGYDFNIPTNCTVFSGHSSTDGASDNDIAPAELEKLEQLRSFLTPLHCAVWERDFEMVEWLLEDCKVDVNAVVVYGMADFSDPLQYDHFDSESASKILFLGPVNLALARGSMTAQLEESFKVSELNCMSLSWQEDMGERLQMIRLLANHGAMLSEAPLHRLESSRTAFTLEIGPRNPLRTLTDLGYWYCRNGVQFCRLFMEMAVPVLLELGAKLDETTATWLLNHSIALGRSYPGRVEMLREFLEKGADPEYFRHVTLRKYLIENWARVDWENGNTGGTLVPRELILRWYLPDHVAEMLELLVEYGAPEEGFRWNLNWSSRRILFGQVASREKPWVYETLDEVSHVHYITERSRVTYGDNQRRAR